MRIGCSVRLVLSSNKIKLKVTNNRN